MADPVIAGKSPKVMKLEPGTYAWCACGKSSNQPMCDGSHQGTGFSPVPFKIEEAKTVAMCMCKHTADQPFCDGTHAGL